MNLNIDINASPSASAVTGIDFSSEIFWKDSTNIILSFLDVDNTTPAWAGSAVVKLNITDTENYPLIDTQTLSWDGIQAKGLVAFNDFRLDTYLDGSVKKQVYFEVQIEYGQVRQTIVKQTFNLYNTFMVGFDVELTLPLAPDLLEVSQSYPPVAPDLVSVIKYPENVLEVNAIIIDGNETYTPYEPSNVIALNAFQCRPPQDVIAASSPAEPSLLISETQPAEPDLLQAGELPEPPDQIAFDISPLAPDLIDAGRFPESPDLLEAETTPQAPDLLGSQMLSPYAPSSINSSIPDFDVSRYSPVVHMDLSLESDSIDFAPYNPATDPTPASTYYDIKIENLVGICNREPIDETFDNLYKWSGYYRATTSDTNTIDEGGNNIVTAGKGFYLIHPILPNGITENLTQDDLAEYVIFDHVPAFLFMNNVWRTVRYSLKEKVFYNPWGQSMTQTNELDGSGNCPTDPNVNIDGWITSDTRHPSDIPWADFTYGNIIDDLRLQSIPNYGDINYQFTQPNYDKRGVLGLHQIDGKNCLAVGNNIPTGDPATNQYKLTYSYQSPMPFADPAETQSRDSTFGEIEMCFIIEQRKLGSLSDHLFGGNGNTGTNDRFIAHAPWALGLYYFDAGNTSDLRVQGESDDGHLGTVLVNICSSVINDKISLRVNGSLLQEKTGAVPINVGDLMTFPLSSDPQNCYVGEVIFFRNTIGEARRIKLEGYLGHKWGCTNKFPEDHPYKYIEPNNAVDPINGEIKSPLEIWNNMIDATPDMQGELPYNWVNMAAPLREELDLIPADLDCEPYKSSIIAMLDDEGNRTTYAFLYSEWDYHNPTSTYIEKTRGADPANYYPACVAQSQFPSPADWNRVFTIITKTNQPRIVILGTTSIPAHLSPTGKVITGIGLQNVDYEVLDWHGRYETFPTWTPEPAFPQISYTLTNIYDSATTTPSCYGSKNISITKSHNIRQDISRIDLNRWSRTYLNNSNYVVGEILHFYKKAPTNQFTYDYTRFQVPEDGYAADPIHGTGEGMFYRWHPFFKQIYRGIPSGYKTRGDNFYDRGYQLIERRVNKIFMRVSQVNEDGSIYLDHMDGWVDEEGWEYQDRPNCNNEEYLLKGQKNNGFAGYLDIPNLSTTIKDTWFTCSPDGTYPTPRYQLT